MIIMILIRIILVILLSYFASKILLNIIKHKNNLYGKKKDSNEDLENEDYIDLCPKCGSIKRKNHNCHLN